MAEYRTVEDLSAPDYSAILVEDDDGFRILCIEVISLPARVWERAHTAGADMILVGETGAISAEDFVAQRTEDSSRTYWLPPLKQIEPGQGFRALIEASVGEEEVDPLAQTKFVHLHTHTEYSTLDGLSTLKEVFATIDADPHGGGAIGVADHGNCVAHPELQQLADKHGVKPVFGMEAYFVPDRHRRSESWLELDGVRVDPEHLSKEEKKRAERKSDSNEVRYEYTHLTLWAEDETGLRNLWAMSTEAYREGLFDGKPRLDWETLERLNEGIVCGTGCLRGPVSRPLMEGDNEKARENLLRLHGIFGDRLYVEIHSNSLPDQIKVNHGLRDFCEAYSLPPVAAVDSHYAIPDHQVVHQTWVAMQTGKTLTEDTTMFQGGQEYHLKTADEVTSALVSQGLPDHFIEEAMANTVEVARRCTAKVGGEVTTPTYSRSSKEHPDPVKRDEERLREICIANWERKATGKSYSQKVAEERFEREMALLVNKKFCGYFLVVWDYVKWAKEQGCLVGPGRGSGGGSLVAFLADITETDPIESDLIFERFLTEGRNSLPDFDIDFPSSWRSRIIGYIRERWGEDYVANIGTITRLRSKAAVNDVVRTLKPILPYEVPFRDFDVLKKAIDAADAPLAGKHLPWEEFKAQYADIYDPMEAAYPEIFAVVEVVMDRVKNYGKHAAGVVISTGRSLNDLPMRLVVDSKTKAEVMVTQFDMNALEDLGYVKFDFLTLRTLDTLQEAIDLIAEKFGRRINPYDWKAEYEDPQVWEEISAGRTLGLFQIETSSGTRLTKRMQPHSLFDLAAVMTVVRPGPMRSGLTESYLRRRAGLEPITYLDDRLEEFLGATYGSMIYQEQVMATCMNLAGYNSTEADVVRKLLGKKQVEKVVAAGEEFVRRAVECGTDQGVAETLWAQMAEFAKYGFNKAHAFAYAVLGYWCGFLRFHYPVEFLVAALSTVDVDRIPEFIEDCRLGGYGIIPPDVNRSKAEFTSEGTDIIYGLSEVKGIGGPTAQQIVDMAPYASLDDFVDRCVSFTGSKVNMGHVRTLVEVGAFDSLVPNRKAVEIQLEREATGEAKKCVHRLPEVTGNEREAVCGFDWADEPDPPMIRRRNPETKKMGNVPKPPPKKCTVGCRQYLKPAPVTADEVAPYTSEEIMFRERELLGTWITHSPFAAFGAELDNEEWFTAQRLEVCPAGIEVRAIGLVEEVRQRRDKNGNDYAFVRLNLRDGEIEAICFASVWSKLLEDGQTITKDRLCGLEIAKTPKGYQLRNYVAVN